MTTIYTKPQMDAIAVKIGTDIKAVKTPVTQLTTDVSKLKADYSKLGSAASRTVGTADGNVPVYSSQGLSSCGYGGKDVRAISASNIIEPAGNYRLIDTNEPLMPIGQWLSVNRTWFNPTGFTDFAFTRNPSVPQRAWLRCVNTSDSVTRSAWTELYTTSNTTVEAGTNYLKVASPILRLQHNSFVKEHEAEKRDIAVENPSVGVYKITGTTGLRDDGTWYFSPPKDEHNNVLCMVEVGEQDGVITVNTYKKKFDFETVSIVPDYEQPTDIPDDAIVMLRFNELPIDDSLLSGDM